jgi:hypothetical protein
VIADSVPPFTLGGTDATAGRLAIDTSQPPVLISQTGTTYVFRYATLGAVTTNDVSVHFTAGAYSFTSVNGSTGTSAAATATPVNPAYTIGGNPVATGDIGYIDVRFTPTTGDNLNLNAIVTGTTAPFTLGGAGLGSIALVPFATLAPSLLPGNVIRFYVTGAYATGTVALSFAANSFQSSAPSGVASTTYGNLPTTLTFTIQQLTATLANPTAGTNPDATTLNNLGYLDVTYPLIGGSPLNPATINGDEFTLSGAGALGVTIGTGPLLIASSASSETYRYSFTGSFQPGRV